jgi:hypothetical protein
VDLGAFFWGSKFTLSEMKNFGHKSPKITANFENPKFEEEKRHHNKLISRYLNQF